MIDWLYAVFAIGIPIYLIVLLVRWTRRRRGPDRP
jgi:hypothetical protein